MFLLPSINMKLRPTILNMKPGTRVVANTFDMEDWEPDQKETIPDCPMYCTALLWIVPAKVDGTWQMPGGTLTLAQTFQKVTGTLGSAPITNGRLNGAQITFNVGEHQVQRHGGGQHHHRRRLDRDTEVGSQK